MELKPRRYAVAWPGEDFLHWASYSQDHIWAPADFVDNGTVPLTEDDAANRVAVALVAGVPAANVVVLVAE
ncbi:hypothetical protein [Corallococcus terminator]|uniref:Uncharacterized protein n=1 Tax=Corallococcus terminator TaxID=2316733 RepID=A0A3A8HAA0_9BACT|nr:hypothetical protein [Corallococcus terminator]RKG68087.1 hypothetical protein D7V88_40840 [Corallococcus terminator]